MKSIKGQKIYDAHMHCHRPVLYGDGLAYFQKRMADKSIAGGSIMARLLGEYEKNDYVANNFDSLYYKEMLPGPYTAYADFYDFPEDNPDYYLELAKKAMAMGFDGFKSCQGLPTVRKRIGFGINHPVYDKFFGYLEEEGIPYVVHVGNPWIYWDLENAPEEAIRLGRVYDKSFLTLEELHREALELLQKFPKLRVTFAHGFYMGDDLNRLKWVMDTYENVSIDLAPGTPFFVDVCKNLESWKKFFEEYQTRILFGTDTNVADNVTNTLLADTVCNFLETPGPYTCHDGSVIMGIDIDGEMLQNICWDNAIRREPPRPLNKPMIVEEAKRFLAEETRMKEFEKENLKTLIRDFSK